MLRSLIPVFLVALALVGCSSTDDSGANSTDSGSANGGSNNVSPAITTAAVVTRENPMADIEMMAEKVLDQKAVRVKTSAFGDKNFTTEVEYVSPDRFRIKSGPGLERIIIGKDVYMFLGDSWAKLPSFDGQMPDVREMFRKERHKYFSDVRFVGEETVNGRPSLVYEYKNNGEGNLGENVSKIWVATDDGLPVRIESRYSGGNLKSMVIEYEYDPSIKIEVPATKK